MNRHTIRQIGSLSRVGQARLLTRIAAEFDWPMFGESTGEGFLRKVFDHSRTLPAWLISVDGEPAAVVALNNYAGIDGALCTVTFIFPQYRGGVLNSMLKECIRIAGVRAGRTIVMSVDVRNKRSVRACEKLLGLSTSRVVSEPWYRRRARLFILTDGPRLVPFTRRIGRISDAMLRDIVSNQNRQPVAA